VTAGPFLRGIPMLAGVPPEMLERLDGRPIRRFLTGSEAQVPRLGETVTSGSTDSVARARAHADLVISPEVDHIGLMECQRLADVRETGRRAAHAALAEIPAGLLP
jgi:hypothetical protein